MSAASGNIETPDLQPINSVNRHESATERAAYGQSLQGLTPLAARKLGRRQAWLDLRSTLPLLLVDGLASWLAAFLAASVHRWNGGVLPPGFEVCVVMLTLLLHRLSWLYPACGFGYSLEFRAILRTSIIISASSAFALMMQPQANDFPWLCWAVLSAFTFFNLSVARPIARRLLCRFDWWTQSVVIVGDNDQGRQMFERLARSKHEGLRPLGIVYDPGTHWNMSVAPTENDFELRLNGDWQRRRKTAAAVPPLLAPIAVLEEILLETGTCRVAVAQCDVDSSKDFHVFRGIPHVMLPLKIEQKPTERVRMTERDGSIDLHYYTALTSPHAMLAKRLMDLFLVVSAAPFWVPLVVLISLAIKLFDNGPVFYRQSRVGRYRQPFKAIKFRSMVCDADRRLRDYLEIHPELESEWRLTHKLQKDPRVTKLGHFLRKTSLDELPQLWNVLVGDMSLVGPRPIIDCSDYDREYIEDYPEVFKLYQMVRPGITGLWQVSGRNATSYCQRVSYDRYYLQNWSITLDIFILWRTIKTALLREGAC